MATVQKWKLGQANTLVGTQTVVGTLYPVNSKLHVITVNAADQQQPQHHVAT